MFQDYFWQLIAAEVLGLFCALYVLKKALVPAGSGKIPSRSEPKPTAKTAIKATDALRAAPVSAFTPAPAGEKPLPLPVIPSIPAAEIPPPPTPIFAPPPPSMRKAPAPDPVSQAVAETADKLLDEVEPVAVAAPAEAASPTAELDDLLDEYESTR